MVWGIWKILYSHFRSYSIFTFWKTTVTKIWWWKNSCSYFTTIAHNMYIVIKKNILCIFVVSERRQQTIGSNLVGHGIVWWRFCGRIGPRFEKSMYCWLPQRNRNCIHFKWGMTIISFHRLLKIRYIVFHFGTNLQTIIAKSLSWAFFLYVDI